MVMVYDSSVELERYSVDSESKVEEGKAMNVVGVVLFSLQIVSTAHNVEAQF